MIVDYACEYLKGNMTLKETLEYITKRIEEEAWKEAIKIYCPKYEKWEIMIDEFIEPYKSEMYNNFWDDYKNRLPLWSSINTNCYVKLKENNND